MTAHPLDAILATGVSVIKSSLKAEIKKYAREWDSVAAFRLIDMSGVAAASIAGRLYLYDAADLATADNGVTCIHDAASRRFKLASVLLASSLNGAKTEIFVIEEEKTLSGATSSTTMVIPNTAIVLAVSNRVTQAITGATSYSCGVTGTPGQFGSGLNIALNSTNAGVIGPTAFYADTAILFTSAGGSFSGGKVRAAIHYMIQTPATA